MQAVLGTPPPGWRAWASVLALFLLSATAWMDRSVISMVIGPIKTEFGVSDVQVGLVAGLAFSVFYILFLVPIGWLADRHDRRLILFLGVAAWSLATLGFGLAQSFVALLAARMMVGSGEGTVSPIAAASIAQMFGRERMGAPMSVYSLGASAGTAAGVLVAGRVLALGHDVGRFHVPGLGALEPWRFLYVALAAPGVLLAFLAFAISAPRAAAEPRVEGAQGTLRARGSLAFIRSHPGAFGYTVGGFVVINIIVTSLLTWSPEYLRRHFGMAPADIAGLIAATSLGAPLLCQLGAGWLANRMMARGLADAPLRLMRWLALAALPFGLGLCWAPTPAVFALCLFMVMALMLASNPLSFTAVQLIAPPELRSGLAAVHLAVLGLVGIGLGSSLPPMLAQWGLRDHSLGTALTVVVVVALVAATVLLRLGEPRVRALLEAPDRTPLAEPRASI